MGSVSISAYFEDDNSTILTKELKTVYSGLKKKYKDVCESLIEYDSKNKTISLVSEVDVSTREMYRDLKAASILSFFNNDFPWGLGDTKELPVDFYQRFFKLFPNMSSYVTLLDSVGSTAERYNLKITENGLLWELEPHDEEEEQYEQERLMNIHREELLDMITDNFSKDEIKEEDSSDPMSMITITRLKKPNNVSVTISVAEELMFNNYDYEEIFKKCIKQVKEVFDNPPRKKQVHQGEIACDNDGIQFIPTE